jgi:hypothetical protein
MKRPYFRNTIVELEKLFIESQLEVSILKDLVEELGYRNVPKARQLLEKIKAATTSSDSLAIPVFITQNPPSKSNKSRIYQGETIFDLEKLYLQSPTDAALVRDIKHELSYRNVPKAKALLKKMELGVDAPKEKIGSKAFKPDTQILKPEPVLDTKARVNLPINIGKTIEEKNFSQDLLELYRFFDLAPSCSDEELEFSRRAKLMQFNPIKLKNLSADRRELAKLEVERINQNFKKIFEMKSNSY